MILIQYSVKLAVIRAGYVIGFQDAAKWARDVYDGLPEEEKQHPFVDENLGSIMWVLRRKIKENGGLGLEPRLRVPPHVHDSVPKEDETARTPNDANIIDKFLIVLHEGWYDLEADEGDQWILREEHKPESIVRDYIKEEGKRLLEEAGMQRH